MVNKMTEETDLDRFNAAMQEQARKKLRCSYDTSKGYSMSEGLGCVKGVPTRRVTIIYNPGVYGRDEVLTCDACYATLRRQVRRHGYKLESKPI